MGWEELVAAARTAREKSYSPYSGFAVGAAVRTESGEIFAGCNVENRSFGLTICAERTAAATAIAAGARRFAAVAVVADATPPATPCGPCREVLAEFGGPDVEVLLTNLGGERVVFRLGELLPHPFVLPSKETS